MCPDLAVRTRFVGPRGSLILDETVIPTPFATAMAGLAWVFSSQERRPVSDGSRVRRVWTDGRLRIPLRLWCREGPSQDAWALEWLSDARTRLRCHPAYVLCDA